MKTYSCDICGKILESENDFEYIWLPNYPSDTSMDTTLKKTEVCFSCYIKYINVLHDSYAYHNTNVEHGTTGLTITNKLKSEFYLYGK